MKRLALALHLLPVAFALSVVNGCNKKKPEPEAEADRTPVVAEPQKLPGTGAAVTPLRQTPTRRPSTECLVDEFGIARKVIVTSRGVKCQSSVPGGSHVGEALKFFWPYFHFETTQLGERIFYRIGSSPRKDSIIGWIDASLAVQWSTRLGSVYVPGYPLLIYPNKEDLIELIRTGTTKASPLAQAIPSGQRKWMPWPIAESHLIEHGGKTHEVVRLLFLGEYRAGSNLVRTETVEPAPAGKERYSPTELAKIRSGVRKIEVVFVVDNTSSTTPYLKSIIEAVQKIARGIAHSPQRPEVSFGLVLYRDYVPAIMFKEPEGPSVVKLYPFENNLQKFTDTVAPLRAAEESSEEWAEAVYDGVDSGISRMKWHADGYSDRIIVLVGDASAHEPGHRKNPRNISNEQLVELARNNRVRIFSLCVKGGGGAEDYQLQWSQFERLAKGTQGQCFALENADRVVSEVNRIVGDRSEKVEVRLRAIDEAARGKTLDQLVRDNVLNERQRTEVVEFLRETGLDLKKFSPNTPTFGTGWCLAEMRGQPLLESKVFMAHHELKMLITNLMKLDEKLSTPQGVLKLYELNAGAHIDPHLFFNQGPGAPDETMDFFLAKKGIPSHHGLLKLTREETTYMPEEKRAILQQRISKQFLPQLMNVATDDAVFVWMNDLRFGWIKESLFP